MRRIANGTTIFLTILAALLFSGCAKHDLSVAKSGAPGRMAEFLTDKPERLYVLTASQTVEVKEIASAVKQVDSIVQKSGGYVQSQSVREEEQANLVLRVPAPQLHPVLDAMAASSDENIRLHPDPFANLPKGDHKLSISFEPYAIHYWSLEE